MYISAKKRGIVFKLNTLFLSFPLFLRPTDIAQTSQTHQSPTKNGTSPDQTNAQVSVVPGPQSASHVVVDEKKKKKCTCCVIQ